VVIFETTAFHLTLDRTPEVGEGAGTFGWQGRAWQKELPGLGSYSTIPRHTMALALGVLVGDRDGGAVHLAETCGTITNRTGPHTVNEQRNMCLIQDTLIHYTRLAGMRPWVVTFVTSMMRSHSATTNTKIMLVTSIYHVSSMISLGRNLRQMGSGLLWSAMPLLLSLGLLNSCCLLPSAQTHESMGYYGNILGGGDKRW
jgi:hypothetical protein